MSETARLAGMFVTAWAAAVMSAMFGRRNWPDAFCSMASPRWSAWALASALMPMYATQPGVELQVCTMPGFPLADSSPETDGHVTVVPMDGPLLHAGFVAERKLENRNVSPEESTRRTGTIVVAGNVTPLFKAAIAGSFHLVILPS